MTTKTVGSGGDYANLAAWYAARPSGGDLVTAAQIWRAEILNPTDLFTITDGTSHVTISEAAGRTSASFYYEITTNAANNASFRNHASVQSNALRYNASNGCAIANTTLSGSAIIVNADYTRISNIQVSAKGRALLLGNSSADFCDINNCIFEGDDTANYVATIQGANNKIRNCLIVQRGSSAATILDLSSGASAYNCTLVVPSDVTAAAQGFLLHYGTPTLQNCAVFHCTSFSSGASPTITACASDLTAATGRIQVAYNTSAFVNITDATRDFRLPSGSGLINVGTTDATNAATDIAGTARPSGASYDIGAWEYVSAGGAYIPRRKLLLGVG